MASDLTYENTRVIPWEALLSALLITLLFIPSRRYTLSSNLPFQVEPYRVVAGLLLLGWLSSAAIDSRVRLRRTPFDKPFRAFLFIAIASMMVNVDRVASVEGYVVKQLTIFGSIALVVYFITSVFSGRPDLVLVALKVILVCGAVLAVSAIFEVRTGYNVFLHLDRIMPFLQPGNVYDVHAATDSRGDAARAVASSQHPIEFGALMVVLAPLALALAAWTKQRRWWFVVALLLTALVAALSRTVVPMLVAAVLAGLWTRRKQVVRLWPALIPAVVVIHFAVPGALGSLTKSFFPQGGLVADQSTGPVGSGRVATFGPAIRAELLPDPLLGEGFSTRLTTDTRVATVTSPTVQANAPILDDQWLGVLLETGVLGFVALIWLFVAIVRRCGTVARTDYGLHGWLLSGITSSVAAFGVGMLTFDAFAFIQVLFIFSIVVGLASALLVEPAASEPALLTPLPRREFRRSLSPRVSA
jgi:hypothetical protein